MKTEEEIKAIIAELEQAIPAMQQDLVGRQANIHANMGALEAYKNMLKETANASKD